MILSESQLDTLKEIINIGVGKSAAILNKMINKHIKLQIPYINYLFPDELINEIDATREDILSSVNLPFRGDVRGAAKLIFPTDSASKLVSIFTDESNEDEDLDAIRIGTLSEIGNIVLNSLVGTISNFLSMNLLYSTPYYFEGYINELLAAVKNEDSVSYLLAKTRFIIEELEIIGDFVLFLEIESTAKLLNMIDKINESYDNT